MLDLSKYTLGISNVNALSILQALMKVAATDTRCPIETNIAVDHYNQINTQRVYAKWRMHRGKCMIGNGPEDELSITFIQEFIYDDPDLLKELCAEHNPEGNKSTDELFLMHYSDVRKILKDHKTWTFVNEVFVEPVSKFTIKITRPVDGSSDGSLTVEGNLDKIPVDTTTHKILRTFLYLYNLFMGFQLIERHYVLEEGIATTRMLMMFWDLRKGELEALPDLFNPKPSMEVIGTLLNIHTDKLIDPEEHYKTTLTNTDKYFKELINKYFNDVLEVENTSVVIQANGQAAHASIIWIFKDRKETYILTQHLSNQVGLKCGEGEDYEIRLNLEPNGDWL